MKKSKVNKHLIKLLSAGEKEGKSIIVIVSDDINTNNVTATLSLSSNTDDETDLLLVTKVQEVLSDDINKNCEWDFCEDMLINDDTPQLKNFINYINKNIH